MTDTVQVALIGGFSSFAAVFISRVFSWLENRKTNVKIDDAKQKTEEIRASTNKIEGELTRNGGSSTKDLIADSVQFQKAIAARQEKTEREVEEMRIRLERDIVHRGKNDPLSATRLFHEAEAYLKQVDEGKRAKAMSEEMERKRNTTFD